MPFSGPAPAALVASYTSTVVAPSAAFGPISIGNPEIGNPKTSSGLLGSKAQAGISIGVIGPFLLGIGLLLSAEIGRSVQAHPPHLYSVFQSKDKSESGGSAIHEMEAAERLAEVEGTQPVWEKEGAQPVWE
ncbi:hypothetical protein EJ08DRAFT_699195 [Tothia fuscella]|uniref:Uncharacterized protein n=1 Tax=Tothia fuscella TaxID=1048955 RepID=A0A9P4NND5_9PEZI|nr:hypothetical protein EJ08DRAFT_699195 [Tothia fuscella]